MPAAAMVSPWRVRTIAVVAAAGDHPDGLAGQRVLAGPGHDPALGLADHLAGDHHDVAVGERRPAASRSAARSSPGRTSGDAVGRDARVESPAHPATRLDRGGGHRGRGVDVGHHQRYGGGGQPGRAQPGRAASASRLVDQPAVEDAAVGAGAVVQPDRRRR